MGQEKSEVGSVNEKSLVILDIEPEANHHAILRKVDLHLMSVIVIAYMLAYIDRVNIGFARLFNLESDLNLNESQFAWCLSIFFVGYMVFEVPSNLLLKKFRASRVFGIILVGWGGVTMIMAATTSFTGLIVCRLLLGAIEAGLYPGCIFCISFWYPRQEQGLRSGYLNAVAPVAGFIGGIIALIMTFLHEKVFSGWRWLFLLEGIPTVIMGIAAWFFMPDDPSTAYFLNTEEREALVQKLKESHVESSQKKFDPAQARALLTDYKIYIFMSIGFIFMACSYSLTFLTPTIIHSQNYNALYSVLFTLPGSVLGLIASLWMGWHSDKKMERSYHITLAFAGAAISFLVLCFATSFALRYTALLFASMCLTGALPVHFAWLNNSVQGSTQSALAAPLVVSIGCFGGIIAGQAYRPSEAPVYMYSNLINAGLNVLGVILVLILRTGMSYSNRKKDQLASTDDPESQFRYIL